MTKNIDKHIATNTENGLAQEYYKFVNDNLKDRIDNYLQTNNVKKKDILIRITEIQFFYKKMFDIQYKISQITPDTILEYYKSGSEEISKINVNAIDKQATNWLNRLSSTLNVLTIKASEFNELDAKRREKYIFTFSIIISALIGFFTSWYFDKKNNTDLNNRTIEIKRYQDSISNKIRQEYILNFDTLKHKMNNSKNIKSLRIRTK